MTSESNIQRSRHKHRSSGVVQKKGLHKKSVAYKEREISKKVFYAAMAVCAFWYFTNLVNLNNYHILDVIVKLLWLPMLIILYLIPIICLLVLIGKKFNFRSFYFYALILCFVTILFVVATT